MAIQRFFVDFFRIAIGKTTHFDEKKCTDDYVQTRLVETFNSPTKN